jgi:DNA-binding transcriptional LysR family regulator
VRGTLTVTAPVTYGLARVAPSMAALLVKHSALSIDLVLEDRVADLVIEGVDVAIGAGAPPPDSGSVVVAQALATYDRVLVASPAYLRQRGVPKSPHALASHQALVHLPGDGRVPPWSFVRNGKEQQVTGLGLRATLRTNGIFALRGAALDGVGIALLPDWLGADDLAAGRLRTLLCDYQAPSVVVSALYRTELRGSPRILAFIDHLKGVRSPRAGAARPARDARVQEGELLTQGSGQAPT